MYRNQPETTIDLELVLRADDQAPRRWYPTVAAGRWLHQSRDLTFFTTSLVHVKEVGTPLTACGRSADGWLRLWECRVPWERGTCPSCLQVVDEESKRPAD